MTALETVEALLGRPLNVAERAAHLDAIHSVHDDFVRTYDPGHCPEALETLEACAEYGDYDTEGENVAFHVTHRMIYRALWAAEEDWGGAPSAPKELV